MGKREKEPNKEKEQPRFFLNIDGERRECTPENTMAFIHENQDHDHIYLIESQEDGVYRGHFVWRDFIKDGGSAFDDLVKYMINQGYVVEDNGALDENDMRAYFASHPEEITIKTYELTPRQERYCTNHGIALQLAEITVEDFFNGRDIT